MNVESTVNELVHTYLQDNQHVDGVRFIDELLLVAARSGQIDCSLSGDHALRFDVSGSPGWEIGLGRAKAKLRMLCARLGVLCTEAGSLKGTLYGGEGSVPGTQRTRSMLPNQWNVRFMNTTAEQSFSILPGSQIMQHHTAGAGAVTFDDRASESPAAPSSREIDP